MSVENQGLMAIRGEMKVLILVMAKPSFQGSTKVALGPTLWL